MIAFDTSPTEIHELIRRQIAPRLGELAGYRSTAELLDSPVYRELAPAIERVLRTPHTGDFAAPAPAKPGYRVVAWNIERGAEFDRQVRAMREHEYLREADVLLLVEADVGMARSGNRDVAREMAQALQMNYVFAPCYLSLVKGSGVERHVEGDNDLGLHGNAILSRYPIRRARAVPLANGIDKMAAREQRLGQQTALMADIGFPDLPATVASVHLDANSTRRHRAMQMRHVLDALPPTGPTVIGGDWNTTTFNSSSAFRAIMGYCRRVLMGPDRVIRNHYLHPDRRFERALFADLEAHGFDYRRSNRLGERTIFYRIDDPRAFGSLAEWVPLWCFPFIRWALRNHGGGCPLKLDWLAVRSLRPGNPVVIHETRDGSTTPLSDHDAVGVDITAC